MAERFTAQSNDFGWVNVNVEDRFGKVVSVGDRTAAA